MKLTIDTKHDSHDDIKHAIEILNNIVNRNKVETPDTTNMMSMFGAPETPSVEPEPVVESMEKKDTGPDFSSFINLTKDPEDKPKVQFF